MFASSSSGLVHDLVFRSGLAVRRSWPNQPSTLWLTQATKSVSVVHRFWRRHRHGRSFRGGAVERKVGYGWSRSKKSKPGSSPIQATRLGTKARFQEGGQQVPVGALPEARRLEEQELAFDVKLVGLLAAELQEAEQGTGRSRRRPSSQGRRKRQESAPETAARTRRAGRGVRDRGGLATRRVDSMPWRRNERKRGSASLGGPALAKRALR